MIQECCKDNTIQLLEENEGYRKSIARVSEGSDIEVESKMPRCLMKAQEVSGLHKGQRGMLECGIRWAVEARRKGRGTKGSKPQKRSKAREGTSSRGRVASGTAGRGRAGSKWRLTWGADDSYFLATSDPEEEEEATENSGSARMDSTAKKRKRY